MRCLTLATEMQQRGADVIFVCSAGTHQTVPALTRSGTAWLEADEHDWNAALADGKLGETPIDLIVIDSYRLDMSFERSLHRHACPILVIDDSPTRPHDCDLLLDMTLHRSANDYAGLLPQHCRVLAGASYTLVRSEFGEQRATSMVRRATPSKLTSVYISLGLTDVGGHTAPIVRSLVTSGSLDEIIVVIGPASQSFDEVIALQKSHARIEVHIDPPNVAELMSRADIAIGTPGTSSWERCCLGLPSILLVVADNQRDNAGALDKAGAARVASLDSGAPEAISEILRELSFQPDAVARMSRQAGDVCDGNGARRVGTAIDELALPARTGALTLRRATAGDARRLWLWRNDPDARAMSGDSRPVAWDAHTTWLNNRLADSTSLIFIVEADGRPCGTVRFHIELTGTAVVSIAMARDVRGLGYGAVALALACREAFEQRFCERIEAGVRRENLASQRTFLKNGFLPASQDTDFFIYHLHAHAVVPGDNRTGIGA